jgi:lipopolysaccharide transport system permease protein
MNSERSLPTGAAAELRRRRARWSARRVWDLVVFRTYADLRAEVDRTYLGFLWWILEPLMFMAVFYYVFGVLRGTGGVEYVAMLLVGLVMWQWIKSGISHSSDSINNSLFLMRQVHLPAALVPLLVISTDTVKFAFVLTILLVALWLMGFPPSIAWFQLPIVLLVAFSLIVGAGTLIAAWCPLFPDLKFVVETFLLLLMFLSGVFFDRSDIPEVMQAWFFLNPIALVLDAARQCLLDRAGVDPLPLASAFAFGLLLWVMGVSSARVLQRRYPKLSA